MQLQIRLIGSLMTMALVLGCTDVTAPTAAEITPIDVPTAQSENEDCPDCRAFFPGERTKVQNAINVMTASGHTACADARNWIIGLFSFKEPLMGINSLWSPNDGNYGGHYKHFALPPNGYYHVHLNTWYLDDPFVTADTLWHEAGHHLGWSEGFAPYFASRCQAGLDPGSPR